MSKRLDPSRFDHLFVLTARGRRWLIPSVAIDGGHALSLGGQKYAEYEIEEGRPISEAVYSDGTRLEFSSSRGEYPRGQRMAAVNRPAMSFAGSTPASPIASPTPVKPTNYERKPGQKGEAVINQKRRITLPQRPFFEAGFQNGSRVRASSLGPGRILLEQIELPAWARNGAEADEASPDEPQSSRA